MTIAAETPVSDELELVVAWRAEQLELAGYGAAAAARLAEQADVDLHVAIGLLAHGCAPALALQILL